MAQMHEVDYEIFGDDLQYVQLELDPGEAALAEAGGMMFMDDGIAMESIFGDGSKPSGGFLDALVGAGKRLLDFAGVDGQFLTGLACTVGNPLLGAGKGADNGLGVPTDRAAAVGNARHQALVRIVEDAGDFGCTRRQRFRTFGDTREQVLVGGIEDAAEIRCA